MELPKSVTGVSLDDEVWLTISLRLKSPTVWADAGHEVAWCQHSFPGIKSGPDPTSIHTVGGLSEELSIRQSRTAFVIGNELCNVEFDRARGTIKSWRVAGQALLVSDPKNPAALIPGIWRAPTDNDRPAMDPYWKRFGVDSMTWQLRSLDISRVSKGEVHVTSTALLTPPVLHWGFKATVQYIITADAAIRISLRLKPWGSAPTTLPRIGLDLRLNKSLREATYLGLGPGESYPDKGASQKMGVHTSSVQNLSTRYEVPQESGNRVGAKWIQLANDSHVALRATSGEGTKAFSWAAGYFSPAALDLARHLCDLKEEGVCLLRLDAATAGVGSAACGPGVTKDCEVKCEEVDFSFLLKGVMDGQ